MKNEVIKPGKFVSLTYSIRDDTGNVLEHNDLPVHYIYGGRSELIGEVDKAVAGKRVGDAVEISVPPEQGFGDHDPSLTFTDEIENVPEEFRFVGAEVAMQNEAGDVKTFYVTRIEDGQLTVDGNHPLAGKTLSVKVKIMEVRNPTQQELSQDGMAPADMPPVIH